ncbi:MAG: hypothetical protein EOP11_05450 [Proteobacteria bacterium]|nr:MAG: hypothetical protein EOP11_05450 [Pseudomonadota bacterium]
MKALTAYLIWILSFFAPAYQALTAPFEPEALRAPAGEYGYPIQDPYFATITAAVLKNDEKDKAVSYVDASVKMFPARDDVPYYGAGQNKVKVRYWSAGAEAKPLVVMVAGLGGHAGNAYYNYLAYHLVKRGFHVLSVPNPFHFSFALSASTSGYPGVTRADAADLYALIQKSIDKLQKKGGLRYTRVGLLGVSLGALEGAFLSELDSREQKLNFKRTLLINPPVDPLFGIQALDTLAKQKSLVSESRQKEIQRQVIQFGLSTLILGKIDAPGYFAHIESSLATTVPERQYLIGSSLQEFLPALLFTTQQTEDLGIFKTDQATADPEPRLKEAAAFGFTDYVEKFLLGSLSKRAGHAVTYDEILKDSSLSGVEAYLRSDSKVLLMHNADDFIVNGDQLRYLQDIFGARMKLYPRGGHLGNIWFPENREAILDAFSPLK